MDSEERKELILAGNIEPIDVSVTLQKNEKAYIAVNAKRTSSIDQIVEKTSGKNKKKGVLVRGAVGFALMGPLGAAAGALTAGSRNKSQTTQKTVTKFQVVDTGELIFTNKRVLFVGNKEILSIGYDALIDYKFGRNLLGRTFSPRYEEMLPHESFVMNGPSAAEADIFFQGITQNLVR